MRLRHGLRADSRRRDSLGICFPFSHAMRCPKKGTMVCFPTCVRARPVHECGMKRALINRDVFHIQRFILNIFKKFVAKIMRAVEIVINQGGLHG